MDFGVWMLRQRYARRTVTSYGRSLERAERWIKRHRRRSLRSATWKDIADYGETLPYSHSSRMQVQSALKAYWRFLGRSDCPAWAIRTPRKPRMVPRPVSREELDAVLAAARSVNATVYALVCCLYYLCLRREEAALLRWADFGEDGRVHVVGKGGVEVYKPVVADVVAALAALERRGEFVFRGRCGGHISLGTINHWTTIVAEISGVYIYPHRFRHTAITNAYEGTQDMFATQELAGHADPRTTRGYTLVSWGRVEAAAAAL